MYIMEKSLRGHFTGPKIIMTMNDDDNNDDDNVDDDDKR